MTSPRYLYINDTMPSRAIMPDGNVVFVHRDEDTSYDPPLIGHVQATYIANERLFAQVRLEFSSHPDTPEDELEQAEIIRDLPAADLTIMNGTRPFPQEFFYTQHRLADEEASQNAIHTRVSAIEEDLRSGVRKRPSMGPLDDQIRTRAQGHGSKFLW